MDRIPIPAAAQRSRSDITTMFDQFEERLRVLHEVNEKVAQRGVPAVSSNKAQEPEQDCSAGPRRQVQQLIAEINRREAELGARLGQIEQAWDTIRRLTASLGSPRQPLGAPPNRAPNSPITGAFDNTGLRKAA